MQRINLSIYMLSLSACAYPINGEWEGIEQHIVIDGDVAEKRDVPFEDCFADVNAEGGAEDESTTCVDRGFSMVVESAEEIVFEATNNLTQGQQVMMHTKSYTAEGFMLSDGENFEIECILSKEAKDKYLYCDFTSTIGYLDNSKLVFQKQ